MINNDNWHLSTGIAKLDQLIIRKRHVNQQYICSQPQDHK
jgi:hypothetical protein